MTHWKPFIRPILFAALFLFAGAGGVQAKMLDRVVAKVNNEIITLSALEERARVDMARYSGMGVESLPPYEEVRLQTLDQMIDEILLIGVAERLNMIVEESQMQSALDDIRARGNLTQEQLVEMLKQEGRTIEEYKKRIREQILLSRVINLEIRSRIKVTKEDIAEYYDAHRKEFWSTPKVRARHILFILDNTLTQDEVELKKNKAQMALEQIQSGRDFVEVAKEFSEDVTASNGGDLGMLEKGKMIAEFEDAAFSLESGQVSGIVRSPYGLHIIKVEEVLHGAPIPMEEVEDRITAQLKHQRFESVFKEYIEDLRAQSFIEKKLGALKPSGDQTKTPVAGNKVPAPSVKEVNSTQAKEQVQRQVEVLPPLEIGKKGIVQKQTPVSQEFRPLEKKLKYYKNLRDMGLITEQEYNHRKKSLLDNL
ncbi:peptidylprolyl isomerase [Nitrospina gracilis]|uniref:peptidylprolyl isomerase n=1 Tax=Nitrospina gracilis TaxID=35801 RepID=UPI001F276D79|nr:peptidylprolyl isomerase [Nitrospina gracilis]MCF8720722.1 peptidyl-prolyl cis-trans isomerase SurA [Nitrospina gracilis Nb-211]